jgi:hypothetical protein
MNLSWSMRLLCILIVVGGFVLAIAQIVLALAAPYILKSLDSATARWRERILYLLQIGPALFAAFIAGAICLPAYVHGERNLEPENVSVLCMLFASLIALWFGFALLRGFGITIRTLRFMSDCRRAGQPLPHSGSIPVLAVPDPRAPVRLIGFLRPVILVSASFMRTAPDAFGLALAHEQSHADHRDNWKLLTLSFLPRLNLLIPSADPWSDPWRNAADWAADDDAVRNDSNRSLLLAEAIVAAARSINSASSSNTSHICMSLTAADTSLAARVDRLFHPRHAPSIRPSALLVLTALVLVATSAACALAPWIYELSERFLHFGAA